jgi:hypothetical protein
VDNTDARTDLSWLDRIALAHAALYPHEAYAIMSDKSGVEESVKVAVRCRPFNQREIDRKATCCVRMDGTQTIMTDPKKPDDKPKVFAFDYSYWSFDGGKENADGYCEPMNGSKYCDQNRMYNDLGAGMLANAWEGYNSTLFAYGQTGSGKSYSVVGYGANKGIVPMFCEHLFKDIEAKRAGPDASVSYEVTFSMLEIYNEVVHDLLNPSFDKKKGLRVRENPNKGFWADGLTELAVDSYKAISERMEEGMSVFYALTAHLAGNTNRTIAHTNMNATSSRAHTIVRITFLQKSKGAADKEMTKASQNCLVSSVCTRVRSHRFTQVDLAGSERVSATGATGDVLKEGAGINQSLSALGNCIHALADNSQGARHECCAADSGCVQARK